MCDIIGELAEVVRIIYAGEGEIGAGGAGFKEAKIVREFPHPPFGHLLQRKEREKANVSAFSRFF